MYVLLSRRKRLKKMANQNGSSLQVYSYGELRGAERLCGGGFGTVYRGAVTGHTERAVWLSRNFGAHPGRQTRPDRRILLALRRRREDARVRVHALQESTVLRNFYSITTQSQIRYCNYQTPIRFRPTLKYYQGAAQKFGSQDTAS
jgi:hypothetical protein